MNSGRLAPGAAEPEGCPCLPSRVSLFSQRPSGTCSLTLGAVLIDTTSLAAFLLDGDFVHTQAPPADQGLSEQERCACPLQ